MSGSARMQEPPAERRMCAVTRPDQTNNALSRARAEISCFFLDTRLGRKSRLSRRTFYGFDSIAESSECPNHSCRAALPGFLRHCRAAFFVAHAVMQDYPNQATEAVRNDADGFVMSQTGYQTAVQDFKDTSFVLHGSIRCLIEKSAHLAVALRRVPTAVHACALFVSWAQTYPRRQLFG